MWRAGSEGQPGSEPAPSLAQNMGVHLPWARAATCLHPRASEDLTVASSEHSETTYHMCTCIIQTTHMHIQCAQMHKTCTCAACTWTCHTSHVYTEVHIHMCTHIHTTQLHATYNTQLHTHAHVTHHNSHVHTHAPQRLSEAATHFHTQTLRPEAL